MLVLAFIFVEWHRSWPDVVVHDVRDCEVAVRVFCNLEERFACIRYVSFVLLCSFNDLLCKI